MSLPDAATRAATRLTARAYEALDAARRIRDAPAAAIASVPVTRRDPFAPGVGPLFETALAFPWCNLDSSYADPPFVFLRFESSGSGPRVGVSFANGEGELIELRDADGNATKAAIGVVRAWASAFVELAEQLLESPPSDDLPHAETLDLERAPAALYEVLRPRFGRRQGLSTVEVGEQAARNGHDLFRDAAPISRAKARLVKALTPHGFTVFHRPSRGGYFIERI